MTSPELHNAPEERTPIPSDICFDNLIDVLAKANIPLDEYGKGEAKSIHHLLKEINSGEAALSVDASGDLLREISLVRVDVLCKLSNGEVKVLKEVKQVFSDGRQRTRPLDTSLGEKIEPGESHADAVTRALREELGVKSVDGIYSFGESAPAKPKESQSYPGLKTVMNSYYYAATIPEGEYSAVGYKEEQEDKTTYFSWEPLAYL